MKIIELLNKIANGEEVPKKIKTTYNDYSYTIWEYNGIDYMNKDNDYLFEIHTRINKNDLNEEIEIIEEEKKMPKKIDIWYDAIKDTKLKRHDTDTSIEILANMCDDLKDKYNEIIDYIQEKNNEEKK